MNWGVMGFSMMVQGVVGIAMETQWSIGVVLVSVGSSMVIGWCMPWMFERAGQP